MIKYNGAFRQRFGNVFYLEPGGGLAYHQKKTDEYYFLPESTSEEQVEELIEQCLKENKDLIFDLVKDNPVVYIPGAIY